MFNKSAFQGYVYPCLFSICFFISNVFAAAPTVGWYGGIGFSRTSLLHDRGTAKYQGDIRADEAMDHANLGGNIFMGKRVSKYLGFQTGFSYPGRSVGVDKKNGKTARIYEDMYNAYVVGTLYLPLFNHFDLFLNAGPALRHFQNRGAGNEAGGSSTLYRYTLFGLNYGAGMQYLYNRFGVRADFNSNYRRMTKRYGELIGSEYASRDWIELNLFYLFAPEMTAISPTPSTWYFGAGVNHISVLNEYLKLPAGSPHQKQLLSHGREWGYEAFIGKRLSTYLGGELGVIHSGDYIGKDEQSGQTVMSYTHNESLYFDSLFYLPINEHIDFFIKAGPSIKHTVQDYVIDNSGLEINVHHNYTFFALNYGAGVQYWNKHVGIRFVYNSDYRQEDYTSRDSVGVDFIYTLTPPSPTPWEREQCDLPLPL